MKTKNAILTAAFVAMTIANIGLCRLASLQNQSIRALEDVYGPHTLVLHAHGTNFTRFVPGSPDRSGGEQ